MAFDPSTSAYSLFPTFQHQASGNGRDVKSGSVSSQTVNPSVSVMEKDPSSSIHISHSDHESPYGLISSALSSIKIREPTDRTDCDGETSLKQPAPSVLEEAEPQGSHFSDRSQSCDPLWFQMVEELAKYSHLEIKTQQNHIFSQNHAFPEAFGKTQEKPVSKDFEQFFQKNSGTTANQQWLFNLPNGDIDSNPQNTKKLPLGWPNSRSYDIPQRQQGRPDNTSPYKDGVNGQPMNHFLDLGDVLGSEKEMRSWCFNPYFSQSNAQLISIEQCTPQEFKQQVSSFQSFMAGENNTLSQDDFPSMHRQTVAMHYDETMAEQCKTIPFTVPSQLGRPFGTELLERNGGENKQTVYYHAFQDQTRFSPQNTNYSEQPKATTHQRNMKQYLKQHIQQTKVQNKIRPPLQNENRRKILFGFPGEGAHARPLTNTDMPRGDKKQGFSQNMYFEPLENMQFKRGDEKNNMIRAANAQKLLPVNGSRRTPHLNSSKLSTRPTRRHERAASGMNMRDMRSAMESAAFNFYDRGMMTRRGESTYHGNASAMANSVAMNQGHPVLQLKLHFDECIKQWRCLQAEREKAQAILSLTFPGKKSAPVTNTNISQTPSHPSRIESLIVEQSRENARVASLLDQMESLGDLPICTDIRKALAEHNTAVCFTHTKHKEEIASMSEHQRQSYHFTKNRDNLLVAFALKGLAATTRELRIALRCALQMTLPKPGWRQELKEHAARGSPSSPGNFYFDVLDESLSMI